jgi:hypothetical protein
MGAATGRMAFGLMRKGERPVAAFRSASRAANIALKCISFLIAALSCAAPAREEMSLMAAIVYVPVDGRSKRPRQLHINLTIIVPVGRQVRRQLHINLKINLKY